MIPEITPACIPEAGDKHGGQHIEEPSSDMSNMAVRDASMGDDEVATSGGTTTHCFLSGYYTFLFHGV